jgi:hypothetical protein
LSQHRVEAVKFACLAFGLDCYINLIRRGAGVPPAIFVLPIEHKTAGVTPALQKDRESRNI